MWSKLTDELSSQQKFDLRLFVYSFRVLALVHVTTPLSSDAFPTMSILVFEKNTFTLLRDQKLTRRQAKEICRLPFFCSGIAEALCSLH